MLSQIVPQYYARVLILILPIPEAIWERRIRVIYLGHIWERIPIMSCICLLHTWFWDVYARRSHIVDMLFLNEASQM